MTASETNIWSSFLKESSKRSQNQEATVIVVGNDTAGKDQLVKTLSTKATERDTNASTKQIASYVYFDADEKDLEVQTRVNVWAFGPKIADKAFEILQPSYTNKTMAIIVLDLSQPDTCVDALAEWLEKVHSIAKQHHDKIAPLDSTAQKYSLLDYLKRARTTKGAVQEAVSEEGAEAEPLTAEEEFRRDFFGIPVVVVGTKADTLVADTALAMKQARELQGRLRSICLEIGAALVFTSAGTKEQLNCAALKKYILHRLYPEQVGTELTLEDKVETCFIPAGFDTAELIKIGTGIKHTPGEFAGRFQAEAGKRATNKSEAVEETGAASGSADFKSDLESEQVWLSGLHQFILQVTSSGAPSASASTAPSTVPSRSSTPDSSAVSISGAGTGAAGGDASAADGAGAGIAAEEAEVKRPTRESSRLPPGTSGTSGSRKAVAKGDSKEVGDFFKKLMNKK